ncbi:MAG: hypothetical protein QFE16_15735 [Pseudomonadota bacterium]|nr:hypothetical protein [Pseudomonadota bacterium]
MDSETLNDPTPAELAERFLPAEDAVFEVLRTEGRLRLWKSTAKQHPIHGEPNRPNIKYHITQGDRAEIVLMGRLETAQQNFEHMQSEAGAYIVKVGSLIGGPA